MNIKTVAKRMAKYLEDIDWTINDVKKECSCGEYTYDKKHKFCPHCGERFKIVKGSLTGIEQLENALKHALKKEGLK